ncbi:MAG: hypothetical protein FWE23_06140 [Chitinivibrionia bacterium]|nr:hypothetical protein [Chitinivibrionia bacterium]
MPHVPATPAITVEFMCTVCGKTTLRSKRLGRPESGKCPRAITAGRPHRWVKNREIK